MLIITSKTEQVIQCIENLSDFSQDRKVLYRLYFKGDFDEKTLYDTIYEVIYCMENGKLCVMVGLDRIYQCFYDMLNQNYQTLAGKKFSRVSIGGDHLSI